MEILYLSPGKGLSGLFYLDQSICDVIKKIQQLSTKVPKVQLIENTQTHQLSLLLIDYRIKLVFHPLYQTLSVIEIDCRHNAGYDLSLVLQNHTITQYSELLSLLEAPFKPTQISEDVQLESYEGLSLLTKSQGLMKILIHKGYNLNERKDSAPNKVYMILPGPVIRIFLNRKTFFDITIGMFPENLIKIMGPPDKVFYKSIGTDSLSNDYFYNYFAEGIDVMFDGDVNKVKKVIFHTNNPAHILFNEYSRANFQVKSSPEAESHIDALTTWEDVQIFMAREFQQGVLDDSTVRRYPLGYPPTQYQRFELCMFEILPSELIASVTVSAGCYN